MPTRNPGKVDMPSLGPFMNSFAREGWHAPIEARSVPAGKGQALVRPTGVRVSLILRTT